MNRRGILGLFAAGASSRLAGNVLPSGVNPSGVNYGLKEAGAPTTGAEQWVNRTKSPKMPEWEATKLLLNDPAMRRHFMSLLYERHRVVNAVDPDIEVLRSFSPMAKITFQRQRNVEQDLRNNTNEPDYKSWSAVGDMVRKFMWGDSEE